MLTKPYVPLFALFSDGHADEILIVGDDSLRRILKQGLKSQTVLQMRVPREQDLLSVSPG